MAQQSAALRQVFRLEEEFSECRVGEVSGRRREDDLRPEYNFRALRVVARGPKRRTQSSAVRLAPDVAKVFPDSQSVNEALRFLVRIARDRMGDSN